MIQSKFDLFQAKFLTILGLKLIYNILCEVWAIKD